MATVNQKLFQKFKRASQLPKRQEGDGHEIQVEVREDEEQSIKLQEIIDLLVAAGYFRARIKGLNPFDKVVGGMTWCIESLNVDVDVDLLFQENSTIGQKIALTEKIVAVLPKIKCPHRIEPHQIQGLDFIHIFPVIQGGSGETDQTLLSAADIRNEAIRRATGAFRKRNRIWLKWLVRTSMEARQEKSAFVRSYAINQFDKKFPIKRKTQEYQTKLLEHIKIINEVYRPHRYYKRKNAPPPDILSKVQITLLEYGFRGGEKSKQLPSSSKEDQNAHEDEISNDEEEQQKIEQLLANLTATKEEILQDDDLTDEEKGNLVRHYESLYSELKDGGVQSKEEQQVALLEEQNRILEENLTKLTERKKELEEELQNQNRLLEEIRTMQGEADKNLKEFDDEAKKNPSSVIEIEELIILNDNLKAQETQFKDGCKKELARLQKAIGEFKELKSPTELTPEQQKEVDELTEKTRSLRLPLAKKNQIVAKLQRQLDDVPNRAELSQYQRRFLELYNQVAAKHKETKQYFTLYNTLEDKRRYMEKELSLLNSVVESYPEAMQSFNGKEEFLRQFQNIVEGVRQNRLKLEAQVSDEKRKRDLLGNSLQCLLELQRAYATAVRQLSVDCRNYEVLLAGRRD